jgi:phosphatidylserine decarboxylase
MPVFITLLGVLFTRAVLQAIFFFLFIIFTGLLMVLLVFFRDPERDTANGIVAVADGVIRQITHEKDPELGACIHVSTFMNLHNVHVNRMLYDGTIVAVDHHPGGYLPAFTKESERNEHVVTTVKTSIGTIKIVQIAGTFARRIVPYVHKGDIVKKGERIGLIRLGSRVDLYLPSQNITICVKEKERVLAGESTIAIIND